MRYLICFFLLFASLGCQKTSSKLEKWIQPSGKLKVLSTTAIVDDIVGQVGGERIDHIALIEGAIDPHSYELVKGDDEKLSYAQVVFCNGLGLEHGASLHYRLQHHPKSVSLGDKIRAKHPDKILFDRGQIDPHIWLDVSLWSEVIDPIVEALSDLDPTGRSYYEAKGEQAKKDLLALDQSLAEKLDIISPEKRYLVTSHDAFNYFTRRYLSNHSDSWKERFCAPEGIAPDGQLSCHDIQLVIDHLVQHRINVIFPESNISRDSLKKIVSVCAEKGMQVKIADEALYSDTLGSSHETYQMMMEHNVDVLCKEWSR